MAGYVKDAATGTRTSNGTSTVATVATGGVPVGDLLVVQVGISSQTAVTSVTDARGNTYTKENEGAEAATTSGGATFSCVVATSKALVAGDAITVNHSASTRVAVLVQQFTGVTATPRDVQAENSPASTSTPSAGPTGTTAQASELVVGGFSWAESVSTDTFTAGSGYSNSSTLTAVSAGSGQQVAMESKIVGATGTYSADGTIKAGGTPASKNCYATVQTYKLSITALTQSLAGTVTPAGAFPSRSIAQTKSGSTTPHGAKLKNATRTRSAQIKGVGGVNGPTGTLTKAVAKTLSGTVTPAGSLAKLVARALTGTITPASSIANLVNHSLSVGGTITPAGAIVARTVARSLAGTITPAASLTQSVLRGQSLSGSLLPAGALRKDVAKALAGSMATAGSLTNTRSAVQSLSGSIAPTGVLILGPHLLLGAVVDLYGSAAQSPAKLLSGQIAPSGQILRSYTQAFAGHLSSVVGVLRKAVQVPESGSIAPAGSLAAEPTRVQTLEGSLAPFGASAQAVSQLKQGLLAPTGALSTRALAHALSGLITPMGDLAQSRLILQALSAALAPLGALQQSASRAIAGSLEAAGALHRSVSLGFAGQLAPTSTVRRDVARALSGMVVPLGIWQRSVSQALQGSIISLGHLGWKIPGREISGVRPARPILLVHEERRSQLSGRAILLVRQLFGSISRRRP